MGGIEELDKDWQPSDSDIQWLKSLHDSLRVGGVWGAPMGFIFTKPAENVLRLDSISVTPETALDVLVTLERCVKIGKLIGVDVQTKEAAEEIVIAPEEYQPLVHKLIEGLKEGKQ